MNGRRLAEKLTKFANNKANVRHGICQVDQSAKKSSIYRSIGNIRSNNHKKCKRVIHWCWKRFGGQQTSIL